MENKIKKRKKEKKQNKNKKKRKKKKKERITEIHIQKSNEQEKEGTNIFKILVRENLKRTQRTNLANSLTIKICYHSLHLLLVNLEENTSPGTYAHIVHITLLREGINQLYIENKRTRNLFYKQERNPTQRLKT